MWYGIASWLEEDEDGNDNDGYMLVTVKLFLCSSTNEKFQMCTGLHGEPVKICQSNDTWNSQCR